MPALLRILDRRKLFSLVKMDDVQRAMRVAGSAFLALFQIDHRGHGFSLSPIFPLQGWNHVVIQFLELGLDPLLRFPQHDLPVILRPRLRVIGPMMIDTEPGFLSGQRSGAHHFRNLHNLVCFENPCQFVVISGSNLFEILFQFLQLLKGDIEAFLITGGSGILPQHLSQGVFKFPVGDLSRSP